MRTFILKWLFGEDYYDFANFKSYIEHQMMLKFDIHKELHNREMNVLMEFIPNYYPVYLEFKELERLDEWKKAHYKYNWIGFFQQAGYLEPDDQEYYNMKKEKIQTRIAKLIANVSKNENENKEL